MTEPVPSSITSLNAEILNAETWLQPAPREALAAALVSLLDALNPPFNQESVNLVAEWWSRNKAAYVAALAHLPVWAVQDGCMAALRTRGRMAKPVDILKPVEDELAAAHTALVRLRMARQVALRQAVATKPAAATEGTVETISVTEMMDEIYAKLGTSRGKIKPED